MNEDGRAIEVQVQDQYQIEDNGAIIWVILVNEFGNIIKTEPQLNKEKADEYIKIIINQLLTNSDSSFENSNDFEEIGICNNNFFSLFGLIYYSYNKTDKIKLKLFNFDKNQFSTDYFAKNKPNYEALKNILGIKEIPKNNMIIQPINLFEHYSLMLFDNNELYLIDFGLTHCRDNLKKEKAEKANSYYTKILKIIKKKEITYKLSQVFNIEYTDQKIFREKLREIVGFEDQELTDNLFEYCKEEKAIKEINILDEKSSHGFSDVFHNIELCKKIKILNHFSIQGNQACGYFCLAALQYILINNLDIEEIIKENKDGIFQISVCKIVLDEFVKDSQKMFLINEKIENDNYDVYDNTKIIIAIKKNFQINIKARNDKLLIRLENDEIIDIKTIKTMLEKKGYKKLK